MGRAGEFEILMLLAVERRKKLYEVSPAGLEVVRRSLRDMLRLARGLDLGVEGQ